MKQNTECPFNTSHIVYILAAYLNAQPPNLGARGKEDSRYCIAIWRLNKKTVNKDKLSLLNLVTSSESLPAELELSVCKSDDVGG